MSGVSAFVLTGGKSSRMGEDKAFLELGGETLLARALDVAQAAGGDVRIVGDPARYAAFGSVIEDEFPGHGPLAGIHAALKSSESELNFILAVDLPFIEKRFVEYLVSKAKEVVATVTLPRVAGRWQPLCAVYRQQFAQHAEQALLRGQNKVDALFAGIEIGVIDETELRDADFSPEIFRNLNTPEEFRAATTPMAND